MFHSTMPDQQWNPDLCFQLGDLPAGFHFHFREYAPEFQVLEILISLEDIHLAQVATLDLLKRHPDQVGIYVAGGGIEGVIQALQEGDGLPGFVTVCPDLPEITRQALIDGRVDMVISHPQEWMARRLVEVMSDAICAMGTKDSVQSILPLTTYTATNV